ncbi:MAG: SAM-dependent methyltransferase [Firmicutes bacterium]|nr:SAM-dependent methyltransferase [Bacillota bacterium]
MVKLTPRLKTIADEIKAGETMADIGTDHGFLPIYLWEAGISPHVIMADISRGSLDKARDNCEMLHPEKEFDLRLGSGIEVLENGEVDAVAIAGMGGILMTEILGADFEKVHSFRRLILQPRNHVGKLRYWLLNNGFKIVNEQLVREGKFICEILTVEPKEVAVSMNQDEDDIEYQYPHTLIKFKNDLTEEYLQRKLNLERQVLRSMAMGSQTTEAQLKRAEYRIEYLEYLLRRL